MSSRRSQLFIANYSLLTTPAGQCHTKRVYKWFQNELTKVDRGRTSSLVVLIHTPWYNSNTAHQGAVFKSTFEFEEWGHDQNKSGKSCTVATNNSLACPFYLFSGSWFCMLGSY